MPVHVKNMDFISVNKQLAASLLFFSRLWWSKNVFKDCDLTGRSKQSLSIHSTDLCDHQNLGLVRFILIVLLFFCLVFLFFFLGWCAFNYFKSMLSISTEDRNDSWQSFRELLQRILDVQSASHNYCKL